MRGGVHLYKTFDAFVEGAQKDAVPGWPSRHSRKARSGDDWDLGASFEDAVTLASDGWEKGRKNIKRLANTIRQSARKQGRRAGHTTAFAGALPNVGAYASGRPDCMIQRSKGMTATTNVVRLTVQLSAHCGTKDRDMVNYGAAVCALVDALIRRGDSVDVFACMDVAGGWGDSKGTNGTVYRINVKRPGRTIDPGRLMFMLGHPAAFRRLGFALYEQNNWFIKEGLTGNYAFPAFYETEHDGIRIMNSAARYRATSFTEAYDDVVEQHNEQSTDKVKG